MKMDSTWRVWTYEFGLGRTKNVLGFGLLFSVHQIEKDWTYRRPQETIVGAQQETFKMEHVDDITHQLAMIIRHNENLKRQEKNGSPAHIISEFVQLLQCNIL
ncbi:hypothetical protein JHK82_044463 [Glycine max]|uniref:DNA-directed RNA polymerase II subunit 1 n=1 Tax=Glycine soja TaxID=3848 RepID=A0A445GG23_GLYSO|nr:hypothetical protein JHK86_044812 [Glycine max]KAG4940787.1 hypothetical protein JHK87_044658 [Glycine soja]KAG4951562.1 hypothetical protein JHK85_045429 [Glycine max]KAG5099411.1 hypothetical protein JHK82_044463 [Glycine max]KAG5108017.1 hypothetical protein JHK84_044924 [Glycine max]